MPLVDVIKASFTAGELSPLVRARADVQRYQHGAEQLENWLVLTQGGVTTRPGMRYVATVKTPSRLTLMRAFEPSTTDAYMLEIGHLYIRIYKNGAQVQSAGVPVEVTTPYQESDLRLLRTAQSNDVMIIVHPSYAPQRLSRTSDTNWTLRLLTFSPPPLFEAGLTPTVALTLSAVSGLGVTATAASAVWLASDIDRQLTSGVGRALVRTVTSSTVATLDILDAFTQAALAAGAWTLLGSPAANIVPSRAGPAGAAISLTLQPSSLANVVSNGSFDSATGWTNMDSGTGVSTIAGGACKLDPGAGPGVASRQQQITGLTAGLLYDVVYDVTGNPVAIQLGTTSGGSEVFAETYNSVGTDKRITFTLSGTSVYLQVRNTQPTLVAYVDNVRMRPTVVAGWRSTDADGSHYVQLSKGVVRITGYSSATLVNGEIITALATTAEVSAGAWTLATPAWSNLLGWPSAVVLYEGRLFFAGSARFPQTLWGSAINDFFNFALGTLDDDAVQFSLVDSGGNIILNQIRWLMPAENMLVGTTHGEYRLIGSGDDPLTPRTPPRTRIQSTFGSDTVQPLKVGAAILFAQRQGSKVREMAFDERTVTTFVARDITVLSQHLLKSARILEMAYQQEPLSIVWMVRSDGTLLGLTYDLSEQVVGWFRVVTDGVIESVATIPHPTANAHQVWLTVKRTINGQVTRFVEYMDPQASMPLKTSWTNPETGDVITGFTGFTVDAGVWYSGAATATITGLSHLNGASVAIVGDGAVFPAQTVSGGQVTLSQAVSTAFVGLPFTARGRTLPPEVPLRGTSQRSQKHWVELRARVQDTLCLVVNGERLTFRSPTMPQDQGVPPFSGDKVVTPLGWDRLARITFVCDQPLPATVVGFFGLLEVAAEQDKG